MMIPDPYDPMVDQGNMTGFYVTAVIVFLALVVGFISLVQYMRRHDVGDSFADDFIPDRAKVGKTLASKPDLRDKR